MRIVYALAGLLAVLVLAAACGDDDGGEATPTPTAEAATATAEPTEAAVFPMTLTDDVGTEVTLEAEPDAIVALASSFVEVLYALEAKDKIVAADTNTDYPPEAESIPKISGFSPSIEGIASYEPDLVLIFYDPGDLQSSLIDLGIPTIYLATPSTVEGVYAQIETIGAIANRVDEAATLVADMRADIADIVADLDGVEAGPSVFLEYDSELFTAGPGSFPDEVFGLLKASNIAEPTGEPFPQMSAEAVIAAEPQVVLLTDAETPETVAGRPGWESLPAVQDGRVHVLPGALLSHASQRLVDDIRLLAELFYPEIFA